MVNSEHSLAYKELRKGFVAGTLIKTSSGYECIENLKKGDEVVCWDDVSKKMVISHVVQTFYQNVSEYLQLTVGNICVGMAQNQCLYGLLNDDFLSIDKLGWLEANLLQVKDLLFCPTLEPSRSLVSNTSIVSEPSVLYDIAVEKYQNFCITENDILVHNFVGVIVPFSIAWGNGAGISLIVPALSSICATMGVAWGVDQIARSMKADCNLTFQTNNFNTLDLLNNNDDKPTPFICKPHGRTYSECSSCMGTGNGGGPEGPKFNASDILAFISVAVAVKKYLDTRNRAPMAPPSNYAPFVDHGYDENGVYFYSDALNRDWRLIEDPINSHFRVWEVQDRKNNELFLVSMQGEYLGSMPLSNKKSDKV